MVLGGWFLTAAMLRFAEFNSIKRNSKLGLSCAKLRASLNFSGLDYILVYFSLDLPVWVMNLASIQFGKY